MIRLAVATGRQTPAHNKGDSEAVETHDDLDEPVYVISVAARLAGLKTWYLRVLNDAGIVVPRRTDSNRRLYSVRDVSRLARVRHLTEDRGVNIDGIKVIFEMEAAWQAERSGVQTADADTDTPPADVRDVLALLPAYTRPD